MGTFGIGIQIGKRQVKGIANPQLTSDIDTGQGVNSVK